MNEEYIKSFDELRSNNVSLEVGDFFDYIYSDYRDFYQFIWEFGMGFFENRVDLFTLSNPKIIFNTRRDTNAVAYCKKNFSIIEIFMGTIVNLHNNFSVHDTLFESEPLSQYKPIFSLLKTKPGTYLYQFTALMFLFHEIGHLIQRNNTANFSYQEYNSTDCEGNEEEKHALEFDADWFASVELAIHINNLSIAMGDDVPEDQKIQFFYQTAELCFSGIYLFHIQNAGRYTSIYYKSKCHPHPSIRLIYILHFFIDTLERLTPYKFDHERIIFNTIKASIEISKHSNPPTKLEIELYTELEKIKDYTKEIMGNCEEYPNLCRNKLKEYRW